VYLIYSQASWLKVELTLNCNQPDDNPCSTLFICGLGLSAGVFLSSLIPPGISNPEAQFLIWATIYVLSYALFNGLSYITVIETTWLWFPDKPGLAAGIVLSGFGLSSALFNNIAFALVNPTR